MSEGVTKRDEGDQTERSGGSIAPQDFFGAQEWDKECTIKSDGDRRTLQIYDNGANNRTAVKGQGLSPAMTEPNRLVASLPPDNRPDAADGESNAVGRQGEVESVGE